jgi:hypothetical protein
LFVYSPNCRVKNDTEKPVFMPLSGFKRFRRLGRVNPGLPKSANGFILEYMDLEFLKVLAPYFTSILGAVVAIGIAVYNNSSKTKTIQKKLSEVDRAVGTVDRDMQDLKKNHFFHLGEYLKKLNAFLHRGSLMDEVEKADMDALADGVAGL